MKSELNFGGSLLKGKRKSTRPLCSKRSLHLVLKATTRNLLKHESLIKTVIARAAKKWGITIYKTAVAVDHIHCSMKIRDRENYKKFMKEVTAILALKLKIKWLFRPFTRIVTWGRDFERVVKYIEMNILETIGFIEYQPREGAFHPNVNFGPASQKIREISSPTVAGKELQLKPRAAPSRSLPPTA